jgi:mRNA interferase MazF
MAQRPEVHRGDVWNVSFRGSGSEIRGRRPAVVLQNDVGNRYAGTTIVAAISRRDRPLPIKLGG